MTPATTTEPQVQPVVVAEVAPPVVPEAPPVEPSVVLENKAVALLAAGLSMGAIDTYLEASLVALQSNTPDASQRFTALSEAFLKIAAGFRLENARPDLQYTTVTGAPFGEPFQVRLVNASGQPVSGAPVRFIYKAKKNGRLAVTGLTSVTDSSGVAGFAFPVPDFSGADEVSFLLDVNAWLERLVSLEATAVREAGDQVARKLEALGLASKGSIRYTIDSLSKSIPMTLVYADYDQSGALLKREMQAGLISTLTKAGFSVSPYTMNVALLKAKDDSTVLLAWLSQGKKTGRAVFGTSQVVEVTTVDKKFTASVTGTLKVYDLETRKLVHLTKGGKAATSSDRTTAITQAQQLLAKAFADELVEVLP